MLSTVMFFFQSFIYRIRIDGQFQVNIPQIFRETKTFFVEIGAGGSTSCSVYLAMQSDWETCGDFRIWPTQMEEVIKKASVCVMQFDLFSLDLLCLIPRF